MPAIGNSSQGRWVRRGLVPASALLHASVRGLAPALPSGWLGFCVRTWIAVVLALAAAFWLQIGDASSAAVCVAILAQPTRGQSLSKAIYRLGGSVVGALVALLLVAMFPQARFMLLGGIGLWLALCTMIGTLLRDFRSYAALLSGYTVAIVGLPVIDDPANAWSSAVSRVVAIALGVLATLLVNSLFGSPDGWKTLLRTLRDTADRVFAIADDAVHGRGLPDETALAALAVGITSLGTQASYTRTELEDGRDRAAGARSALLGLIDMLACARALAHGLAHGGATPALAAALPAVADAAAHGSEALREMPGLPAEAFLLERSMALGRHRRWVEDGLAVLAEGGPPLREVRIRYHHDRFAVGLNGVRVLIAFAIGAAISILSGMPDATLVLIEIAALCALVSTNPNPTSFAWGTLLGAPLAVAAAALVEFGLLTQGSALPLLAMALIAPVFVACILVLDPRTGSVGFIMLVFTFVILNPANVQGFDVSSFVDSSVLFLLSAILIFLSMVLILPVQPRQRLLRGAVSIAGELGRTLAGAVPPEGAAFGVRNYDRLAQVHRWNGLVGDAGSRRFVLARLVGLTDLVGALARARRGLADAAAIPALRETAAAAGRFDARDVDAMLERMDRAASTLLRQGAALPAAQHATLLRSVSGLHGAALLLRTHRRMLMLTGVLGGARR